MLLLKKSLPTILALAGFVNPAAAARRMRALPDEEPASLEFGADEAPMSVPAASLVEGSGATWNDDTMDDKWKDDAWGKWSGSKSAKSEAKPSSAKSAKSEWNGAWGEWSGSKSAKSGSIKSAKIAAGIEMPDAASMMAPNAEVIASAIEKLDVDAFLDSLATQMAASGLTVEGALASLQGAASASSGWSGGSSGHGGWDGHGDGHGEDYSPDHYGGHGAWEGHHEGHDEGHHEDHGDEWAHGSKSSKSWQCAWTESAPWKGEGGWNGQGSYKFGVGFCGDKDNQDYDGIVTNRTDTISQQGCSHYCNTFPEFRKDGVGFTVDTEDSACICQFEDGGLPAEVGTPAFDIPRDIVEYRTDFNGTGPVASTDGEEDAVCYAVTSGKGAGASDGWGSAKPSAKSTKSAKGGSKSGKSSKGIVAPDWSGPMTTTTPTPEPDTCNIDEDCTDVGDKPFCADKEDEGGNGRAEEGSCVECNTNGDDECCDDGSCGAEVCGWDLVDQRFECFCDPTGTGKGGGGGCCDTNQCGGSLVCDGVSNTCADCDSSITGIQKPAGACCGDQMDCLSSCINATVCS